MARLVSWKLMNIIGLLAVGLAALLIHPETARATIIEFVPPNEPTGGVLSANRNEYAAGRGIVFEAAENTQIDSVGIFVDLTGITLSFEVAQVPTLTGFVAAGQTILRSGSALVTTAGLAWFDFGFSPLDLLAGEFYHIEFTHLGIGNQNFFYNNDNVRFDQSNFLSIDGTAGARTENFVMPAIRLNTAMQIPEPATFGLFVVGLAGLGVMNRRRRKHADAA